MTNKYEHRGKAKRGEDPILLKLGAKIRKLRDALELRQDALAERCGKTQPWLSLIERGLHDMHVTDLYALARGLRTSVTELLP